MNMSPDDATARVPGGWCVPARELFIDTAQRVTDGPLSVVYSFTGGSDGSTPAAEVFADRQGNLLGTTNAGGIGDNGTIFSITPDHKLTTLYSFTGATGSHPSARLIEDQAEGFIWLYGSTYVGGNGNGVIFRVKR